MNRQSESSSRGAEVLAAVHRTPGITRAELTEQLALSSGLASDLGGPRWSPGAP